MPPDAPDYYRPRPLDGMLCLRIDAARALARARLAAGRAAGLKHLDAAPPVEFLRCALDGLAVALRDRDWEAACMAFAVLQDAELMTRKEPTMPPDATEPPPSPILRFFDFEHLPPHLQAISAPIGELARHFDAVLPGSAEKAVGLRKLLEAKDAFVRAALPEK